MSSIEDVARQLQAEVNDAVEAPLPQRGLAGFNAWFGDLPLSRKLASVFGAFLGVFVVMALVLSLGMSELYTRTMASGEVQGAVKASADLRSTTGEFRYNAVRFIFAREKDVLERQKAAYAKAETELAAIDAVVGEHLPASAEQLAQMKTSFADYEAKFDELVANIAREGASKRSSDLAFELSAQGDALYKQADAFESGLVTGAQKMDEASLAYFYWLMGALVVAAAVAGIILVAGFRALSRQYAAKIGEITKGMTRLAKGDRHFEIDGIERKDEVGEMLRAIALFKKANVRLEQWAAERAERNAAELKQQERASAEQRRVLNELASQFERTVGDVVSGVAAASSQLKGTAGTMAGAAEEATRRTSDVVRSMTEANAGANAAAAASDEFAMSIGEISRQAASSAQLAREASGTAGEADATISALSSAAEEIGQIVDMIQSIARRTNLLALNASIEAARGGEAGRGFAVVASEVKELAAQTSQATEKVAGKIEAIQQSTGASVNALRRIAGQIGELESTAVSIASAVDQQSVAGQDLARSIDMAARATNAVSTHVEDVRELSLSTGAAASQVLSSSTELEHQADDLRKEVEAFLARVRAG